MIRKLENTFTALIVSAALLAVGLMLAQPVVFPAAGAGLAATVPAPAPAAPAATAIATSPVHVDPIAVEALAEAAALTAGLATAAALASTIGNNGAAPSSTEPEPRRKARRHQRQALVMPYFSFAPRG